MNARMSGRLLWLLLIVAFLGVGFLWISRDSETIRSVTFSDGTTVRLAAVSYGTNHLASKTLLGRLVCRLPASLRNFMLKNRPQILGIAYLSTSTPSLVVWTESVSPPMAPGRMKLHVFLRPAGRNHSGFDQQLTCVSAASATVPLEPVDFNDVPFRSPYLELLVFGRMHPVSSEQRFLRFPNPAYSPGQRWRAQPLPAIARDGSLQVTLFKLDAGRGVLASELEGVRPGFDSWIEPGALIEMAIHSPENTNSTWSVFAVELEDGAGRSVSPFLLEASATRLLMRPVLWDEGEPWKVRLHLAHLAGLSRSDLVVFTNVPLPGMFNSYRLDLTNTSTGVGVVLRSISHQPDIDFRSLSEGRSSELRLEHPNLGTNRDFGPVQIVARPSGSKLLAVVGSEGEGHHTYQIRSFPEGSTHLDLTFSVQPTRYVEFIVNPNWVTNEVGVPR